MRKAADEIPEDSFDNVGLGTHLCSIYKNKKEQYTTMALLLKHCERNNYRCIYVINDDKKGEVVSELEKRGINIRYMLKQDRLIFKEEKDTYLMNDYFDPDRTINLIKKSQEKAITSGYSGLMITGHMLWSLKNHKGSERLVEYESKINRFYPTSKTIGVCQYDEKKFNKEVLVEVLHTHEKVILYGKLCDNKYYYSPDIYLNGELRQLPGSAYELIKEDLLEN